MKCKCQKHKGHIRKKVTELHTLSADEIDISPLDISANKLHPQSVSYVYALVSLSEQSFYARLQHANKGSLRGRTGDQRVEHLTDPMAHRNRRQSF
jgi:hypothetical protein